MRIKDVIDPWPPSSGWVGSYSGCDPLSPNVDEAVVRSAVVREAGILLEVSDGTGEYIDVTDHQGIREKIAESLMVARDKTLKQVGMIEMS